jgi:hypothetical protein
MASLPVNGSRVTLPGDISRPFQVFVNGVAQVEGSDYEVHGGTLVFGRELVAPRRDTVGTYARLMFWGRYKKEHTVDVAYEIDGRPRVATGLPIEPGA